MLCLGSSVVQTVLSAAHLPLALLLGLEVAGMAVLILALVLARAALVTVAVLLAAIPAGAALALGGPAPLAPVIGALLLAGAELGFWSIERQLPARESLEVGSFRALWLVGVALAGCGVGMLLSLVSDAPVAGGFDLTALGIVAVISIPALLLWLGRDALRGPG
ncbi:MAG: hypothetical protein ACRENY_00530 [Candidatus Dormibacteria bacterium]